MTEDFVTFEIAKKLKKKGFRCNYPFAMYSEGGLFYACYTSAGYANYYDYNDFDESDYIAPTISQALKWLRKEKRIFVDVRFNRFYQVYRYYAFTMSAYKEDMYGESQVNTYEQAALAGIEYALDNLI